MAIKKMINLRKKINAKKPNALRRNFGIKKRLSKNWRKPKGLQNKLRLHKKGYGKHIRAGYGSPNEVKHLDTKTGLYPILVSCKSDLDKVDPKTQGVLIRSTVGIKKRLELVEIIEKKNLTLIQDSKKLKNKLQAKLDNKKEAKKKIEDRKLKNKKKQKDAQKKKKSKDDKKDESEKESDKSASSTHDNVKTKKSLEADKANKEILQKKL